MPGASPMPDSIGAVRRLEDAGASAIVMHSLFEEQFTNEDHVVQDEIDTHENSSSEATTFLPIPPEFNLEPSEYLEQIRSIKEALDIPVIASLNGATPGGWVRYATEIEQAGAAALELNFYHISTSADESGTDVEKRACDILKSVKESIKIPVAIKLSPFFSSLPNFSRQLVASGADGIILFNRFYQPDIDTEELDVLPTLQLSNSFELRLRLRWLAIMSASVPTDYACSGGAYTGHDAIKALMTGATVVQFVSSLLKNGPEYLTTIIKDVEKWMEEHDYQSVDQLRGCMSLKHCPDPLAYERGNYLRMLQGWKV
jgi:dihydroorotate dehydrogenase (fumarate)